MSTLEVSNLNDGTTSVPTTYITGGSAKAWVYGTNAAVVNGSLNVSSGTDNSVGDYTYALTSAMADNSYSQSDTPRSTASDKSSFRNANRDTASVLAVATSDPHAQSLDDQQHHAQIFGDLA